LVRRGIEVDGNDVYWSEVSEREGNVVRAAPKNGSGPVRTLGQWYDFGNSRSLLVDDQHVYWLKSENTGGLLRVDKDGGNPVEIPLPADPNGGKLAIGPLAQTDDAVILATLSCSQVLSVSKDGSAITLWPLSKYPDAGGSTGLDSFDGIVYCSNGSHIHSLDPATGEVTEIVYDRQYLGALAMAGGALYFAINDNDVTKATETLGRYDAATGTATTVGPAFGTMIRLHYDDTRERLYWLTGLSLTAGNVVAYSPASSGLPELVFGGQDVQGSSAMDADYLYWASDQAVTRLHKTP